MMASKMRFYDFAGKRDECLIGTITALHLLPQIPRFHSFAHAGA